MTSFVNRCPVLTGDPVFNGDGIGNVSYFILYQLSSSQNPFF